MPSIPSEIFKAYDIRGVVGKTLTPEVTEAIGRAVGSQARELGQGKVCIGRDGRLSGPSLSQALARGLQSAGVDVIDIGRVTTPMLYFATHQLQGARRVDHHIDAVRRGICNCRARNAKPDLDDILGLRNQREREPEINRHRKVA